MDVEGRRGVRTYMTRFDTPVGPLLVVVDGDGALIRCSTSSGDVASASSGDVTMDPIPFADVVRELSDYFAGRLTRFTIPLRPSGSEFQQAVWRALEGIPYGTTITYRQLAERVGRPLAIRAAGGANGANPIAIIVPCHRVIGSDGSLTGYGGGIAMKRSLLEHERLVLSRPDAFVTAASIFSPNAF